MTIKQKFSSIDQSKLTADQKAFLEKIKNVTKDFTDSEMNKKVEQPLDNFIAKAKEKMPEAIKSAPVKRTAKAKPSQTRKPKRTAMSLAKEIRKEGESWNEARARASKMMKEDSKDLSKTVESELDKLSKLVRSEKTRSKLVGISDTDIKRDAVRKAKPRGARKVTHSGETSNQYGTFSNHVGRKYYESRDRHSDRLAPRYPKNAPLLAEGGYLTDSTFGTFQNQVFAEGGDIDAFTLRMVKSNGMQPAEVLKEDANVKYNKGGAVTNERRYVNKGEDYEVRYSKPILRRKGYQGKRDFMAGGSMETPRIYVADLEAYNNGRLVGEWLDLADYNDADELMDAIQDVLKKSGGEEYAIHDVEYVPRSLYSEYMGRNDFQALYEVMETAKRFDLPLEVVQEIVSQYGEGGVDEFYGKYDSAEDFAIELADDLGGLQNFSSPEYYVYITETDRRLLAQEQADTYVDDIKYEDGGNRLIEEAGLDVEEYEEADSDRQEEMLDEAREIVYDEYYDNWYEGLSDPYYFLVEEQGLYSPEDLFNDSFIRVDYERLARDLEQDYTFIEHDGDLYVFNIR